MHGMLTYFPCAIGSGPGKQGRGCPSHRQATRWQDPKTQFPHWSHPGPLTSHQPPASLDPCLSPGMWHGRG